MTDQDRTLLDRAYAELEAELAAPFQRALRSVRAPQMKWARITTGAVFIVGGSLSFLPVLGIELLPLGLLLIAEDVPRLRAPVAHFVLWALDLWRSFKAWVRSVTSGDESPSTP